MRRDYSALCLAVLAAPGLHAQSPPPPNRPAGWVEGFAGYHDVSNGFGNWKLTGIRLAIPSGQGRAVWYLEALAQDAFGDRGVYGAFSTQFSVGNDWILSAGMGAGTGDFFFPDLRADASLGRRWLAGRNLVTTVGLTRVDAKHGFDDLAVTGSAALYLGGVVLQAGATRNWSDPGSVPSERVFAAITIGRDRSGWLAIRGSRGTEAYQLAGPTATLRDFTSSEASVRWQQWVGPHWGSILQLAVYDNPFYGRAGGTFGLFRSW